MTSTLITFDIQDEIDRYIFIDDGKSFWTYVSLQIRVTAYRIITLEVQLNFQPQVPHIFEVLFFITILSTTF